MYEDYDVKFTLVPELANGLAVSNPDMIQMFISYYNCSPVVPIEYREKVVGENIHASISIKWGDTNQRGMAIISRRSDDRDQYNIDSMYDMKRAMRAAGIQCDESLLLHSDATMFALANSFIFPHSGPNATWGTCSVKTVWMREQDCTAPVKPNPNDIFGTLDDDD